MYKAPLLICIAFFLTTCGPKTASELSSGHCGDVSVRLLYSLMETKFAQILNFLEHTDSNDKRKLIRSVKELQDINNQMIIDAGGFKTGKSLQLVKPCRHGKDVAVKFQSFDLKTKYKFLISLLKEVQFVSGEKADNLMFIIDSYFCSEGCSFSKESLETEEIGYIALNNMVLMITIFDLVMMKEQ